MGRKDKSLEDKVYNYLHDIIIQYKLQVGRRVIESDIADCLGMSRTLVRAALWRLEERKLAYSLQDPGTLVEQLTVKNVLEMDELRIVLEIKALESCVIKAADEDANEYTRMTGPIIVAGSAQDIKIKDEYFNNSTMHYYENSRVYDILHSFNTESSHPKHLVALTEKRPEVTKQDHLKIPKYIKARSYSRAVKVLGKYHNNRYYGFMEEYVKMVVK